MGVPRIPSAPMTKIQAAQRQIDAAIWMLFRNDDPVAIHTVAMAAFRILRDLAKQRGLEHSVDSMIRPGKEKEFWRGVNSFANFFKHADKDPDDISGGFFEEANDLVLLIAAKYYDLLGYQQTEEMQALEVWYVTLNPDVLSQDVNSAVQALVLAAGEIRSLPREQHLPGAPKFPGALWYDDYVIRINRSEPER